MNLVNRCPYNINATATDLYNTQESTNVLAADGGSKDLSELSANKDWRGVFYASSTSGPPMPLGGSSMKVQSVLALVNIPSPPFGLRLAAAVSSPCT